MREVAIVRRNGLGDLLTAYPLLLFWQKTFPDDHLTLFVGQRSAPLVPYLPLMDDVVVVPNTRNKYLTLLQVALAHRHRRFDLAISTSTAPRPLLSLFLFALGAKARIAYVDQRWHRRLITEPRRLSSTQPQHQSLKILRLVDPTVAAVPASLYPSIRLKRQVRRPFPGPTILMTSSTTREANRLDARRYAGIVNRLYQTDTFSVLIVGQERDRARGEALADYVHAPNILCIPENFDDFINSLACGDLYFVGDGGVAHLGAALGKEEVVLFGVSNPAEWTPLTELAQVFYDPVHVNCLDAALIENALRTKLRSLMRGAASGDEQC